MANFKNLEMAQAVANHNDIIVKKTFFSTKVVYQPTQSPLRISTQEYTPDMGERMERLLKQPVDKLANELQQKGKPTPTPVGQYRLEVAAAEDGSFIALQLFRFVDFNYQPVTDTLFYIGADVAKVSAVI